MKVCDLTQFYSPVSGGVKRYLSEKSHYIRRHRPGDEHVMIVPGESTDVREVHGARFYTIASPLISRKSRYRILTRLHVIEEILENERPDIIESGDPYQVAWKAIASGQGLHIPVVGFYHSHFPEAYIRSAARFFGRIAVEMAEDAAERYVRMLYNGFARTLVPSPALADKLRDWGVQRVECIDLGVDTDVFRPDEARGRAFRAKLGIPDESVLLAYAGRLAPEKNLGTLFRAFAEIEARSPRPVHLLVVGDGTLRPTVERFIRTGRPVTLLAYQDSAERLADVYRAADIFVHPGLQETFGLVALESQACGTPVIGIRGSYMDRIIFGGGAHWANENTPSALADGIVEMIRDDFVALGREAGEVVARGYAWTTVFGRLFSVYESVVASYKEARDRDFGIDHTPI